MSSYGSGKWYGGGLEEWLIIYRIRNEGGWKTEIFFGTKKEARENAHQKVLFSPGWIFKDIIKKEEFIEWKKKEYQKYLQREQEEKMVTKFKTTLTKDLVSRIKTISEERICVKCGKKFVVKPKSPRILCGECSDYGDAGIIKGESKNET